MGLQQWFKPAVNIAQVCNFELFESYFGLGCGQPGSQGGIDVDGRIDGHRERQAGMHRHALGVQVEGIGLPAPLPGLFTGRAAQGGKE